MDWLKSDFAIMTKKLLNLCLKFKMFLSVVIVMLFSPLKVFVAGKEHLPLMPHNKLYSRLLSTYSFDQGDASDTF